MNQCSHCTIHFCVLIRHHVCACHCCCSSCWQCFNQFHLHGLQAGWLLLPLASEATCQAWVNPCTVAHSSSSKVRAILGWEGGLWQYGVISLLSGRLHHLFLGVVGRQRLVYSRRGLSAVYCPPASAPPHGEVLTHLASAEIVCEVWVPRVVGLKNSTLVLGS